MFDNFEMTIVRVEGLGNISKCKCVITINEQVLNTIEMRQVEHSQQMIIIPSKGILRLSIEDHLAIASLRFSMKIIKCQGYHWLPLFTTPQDMIFEVPEEVGLPRILLILQSQKFLSPVIEITETSEVSENIEGLESQEAQDFLEDSTKNVELRMKILELEHNLQFERTCNGQTVEKIQREHKVCMDKVIFECEKFRIWSEKFKEKAAGLEKEVEAKDKKILEVLDEKDILRAEMELYKKKYQELMMTQESVFSLLKKREEELDSVKVKIGNLENNSKTLQTSKPESISIPPPKKKKKHRPRLLNMSVENINPDITVIKTQEDSDTVDYQLQISLNSLKLEGFFQRTYEHYYKVGCKKVGVVLKNNSIYCKFGDTFKTLENYIFSHCTNELETFIKKRANLKASHKRFNSFSSTFDQSTTNVNKSFKIENENSSRSLKNKSITPCLANRNKRKSS
jgi:hypothetical protein